MTEAVSSLVQSWPQGKRKYNFFPLNKSQLLLRKYAFFILKGYELQWMKCLLKYMWKFHWHWFGLISINLFNLYNLTNLYKSLSNFSNFKTYNISWLSNWLIVSFSGSEPCNPKIASHFLYNCLENWKLRFFLMTTQVMVFVFACLFSVRVKD